MFYAVISSVVEKSQLIGKSDISTALDVTVIVNFVFRISCPKIKKVSQLR